MRRNAETVRAMGLRAAIGARIDRLSAGMLDAAERAGDAAARAGSAGRILRQAIQSAVLGVGAWAAVEGQLSAGAMIAASILAGRALAPLETAIAHRRDAGAASEAYALLAASLPMSAPAELVDLPAPKRRLDVEGLTVVAPGGAIVLRDVAFSLQAGEILGVVGPSGSGKSSLARALAGIWPAARGAIRLDGSELAHFPEETRGAAIGYLAQEPALFDATIAETIARLDPQADDARVVAAAESAGAHALIQRLPAGYGTRVGEGGAALSGGQRQRVGLARALYGDPFLVVLDEPNANLDADGEAALGLALEGLKARGAVAVVVSHRPAALARCDRILVLDEGRVRAFGPRADILKRLMAPAPRRAPAPALAGGTA